MSPCSDPSRTSRPCSDVDPAGDATAREPLIIHLAAPLQAGSVVTVDLAATLHLPSDTKTPSRSPSEADGPKPRLSPGLVVGHGAGSDRSRHEEFCREACRAGFVALGLDFRGHGDSTGEGDGPLELDILAAVAYLRARPEVDGDRVCYRGSSMGGFYGLKAAPPAGFAAMALLCPASEAVILDAIDEHEGSGSESAPTRTRWDESGLRSYFLQQDSRVLATRVSCPVLLIHARGDDVVPFAHSLLLAEHLGGEVTLLALPGGTHTTAQHDGSIHRRTLAWLHDRLTSACTGHT